MSNNSSVSYSLMEGLPLNPAIKWTMVVVCCLIVVVGYSGNTLIIATMISQKLSKNIHNIFIINLAIADAGVVTLLMPNTLYSLINGHSLFPFEPCRYVGFVAMIFGFASLNTLMAISVNRYLKILHYRVYQTVFSNKRSLLVCVFIWVYCTLMASFALMGWGDYGFDRKGYVCAYDRMANLGFTIFMLCNNVCFPTTAIIFSNYKIYKCVKLSKERVSARKVNSSDLNLMKSLFVTFLILLTLFTPYTIVSLMDRQDTFSPNIHIICAQLTVVNYACNFFIYSLINERFRQSCLKLLRRYTNRVETETSTQVTQLSHVA